MDDFEQRIMQLVKTYKKPDEFFHRVEKAFRVPSNQKANFFFRVGSTLCNLSYLVLALNSFNLALKYCIRDGDRKGESACYGGFGIAYRGLGDLRKAIEYQEKSLKIAIEIDDRREESESYLCLGNAYTSLGDLRKAIECHKKSLKIAIENGYRTIESASYLSIGIAYVGLGDLRKAIEYLEKSKEIAIEIDDLRVASASYRELGNAFANLGDFRKAIENLEKSLEIAIEIESRADESMCYLSLGNAYTGLGDLRKAIECHKKSLKIAIENGYRTVESRCYLNLGVAYRDLGNFRKAIECHEESLKIAVETGDIDSERVINFSLGLTHYASNSSLEVVYDYCKRSIELSEVLGGRLVQEERRIGFYARSSDVYQFMVPLCLKLRKGKEAFEYVERSKSRAFLDLIAATEIKPTVELTSKFKSLLDDEGKYLAKLSEIQTRHLRPTSVLVEPGEVEHILENLNLIHEKMEEFDPEYVFMRRGKPLSLAETQDMLSLQRRNITLIEYFITGDETFILVVSSKDRTWHIVPVPLSMAKIDQFLDNYWREVVNYPHFKDIGDTWLNLSDYLIEPISEFLTEGDLIYFAPYGSLHYLPMHALESRGEPLIIKHPVAYAPSASLIKFCRNKGSGKLQSCASFGVVFEEEAEDVAKLFNTKAYEQATKDKVRENFTDKDIIHFSCHGYFDDVDPLSSGVLLYDKVLTAREIFNIKLNTELITLSACQTGLSKRSPGDELIGLTRAFLYAGSPSVIVSLWSVDVRSTQELMLEFYTLLKNGTDKATALQEAQKKIMQKEGYSHPYYWAPFVLVGDWALAR